MTMPPSYFLFFFTFPLLPHLSQGLTEQQVVQQGLRAEVYTNTFTPLRARLAGRADGAGLQQGFVKMLVECGSGKVLGLHMVGEEAPEIIQVRGEGVGGGRA